MAQTQKIRHSLYCVYVGSNPTLSAKSKGLFFRPFSFGGAGCAWAPQPEWPGDRQASQLEISLSFCAEDQLVLGFHNSGRGISARCPSLALSFDRGRHAGETEFI